MSNVPTDLTLDGASNPIDIQRIINEMLNVIGDLESRIDAVETEDLTTRVINLEK